MKAIATYMVVATLAWFALQKRLDGVAFSATKFMEILQVLLSAAPSLSWAMMRGLCTALW
jgi:hypothetical protein